MNNRKKNPMIASNAIWVNQYLRLNSNLRKDPHQPFIPWNKRIVHLNIYTTFKWFISLIFMVTWLGMASPNALAQDVNTNSEKSLLILHTNDMHDHIRPDYTGIGGMPFVSGYIRKVRKERPNILVLDAGDVAEKGELVARHTNSEFTFEMMARIGYDAWTPGNHDYDFGMEALPRFTEIAGMDLVCINLLDDSGKPAYPVSRVYNINGLRIGVIGAIAPRNRPHMNLDETAIAMRDEANRLENETDILVGLMHISNRDAALIARVATGLNILIAGHSHEETHEPVIVPETGALIVQAGDYARMVGRLDLVFDTVTDEITSYSYELVEMDHHTIEPDIEMIEMVRRRELELTPESQQIVSWSPRTVSYAEVGLLAAEALRIASGADIALHKTRHIVRAELPAGILDVNAFYRTGGERGNELVLVELTGLEINHYIQGLPMNRWLPTQWSGFKGGFDGKLFHSDLNPARMYRVVMPLREWDQRFYRMFDRVKNQPENWPGIEPIERSLEISELSLTWTDAVRILLEQYRENGNSLLESIGKMAEETGQTGLLDITY
jgi:2',3'-cyclic-nucleotide 2'-phosphodiesterase (5'-nucleotidase family)